MGLEGLIAVTYSLLVQTLNLNPTPNAKPQLVASFHRVNSGVGLGRTSLRVSTRGPADRKVEGCPKP